MWVHFTIKPFWPLLMPEADQGNVRELRRSSENIKGWLRTFGRLVTCVTWVPTNASYFPSFPRERRSPFLFPPSFRSFFFSLCNRFPSVSSPRHIFAPFVLVLAPVFGLTELLHVHFFFVIFQLRVAILMLCCNFIFLCFVAGKVKRKPYQRYNFDEVNATHFSCCSFIL